MNRKQALWMKYAPRCKGTCFDYDSKLSSFYKKNAIDTAGIDHLKGYFLAGTPCSTTHLFWLVLEGEVFGDVGSGRTPMKKNSFLISPVDSPHWIELRSHSAKGLWVHFTPSRRWDKLQSIKGIFSHANDSEAFDSLIRYFLIPSHASHGMLDLARLHAMELLLIQIDLLVDSFLEGRESDFTRKIRELETHLLGDLKSPWNVRRMAGLMKMSSSHFYRETMKHRGITPMNLVLHKRIERAQNLLLRTDQKIAQIAEEVGFSNSYSFSNSFKRITGKSPKFFRMDHSV